MQKAIGIVLLILGIIGTIYFGVQAIQQSESFNLLGYEVAVSSANWTPVIISAAVLIIGLILSVTGKTKTK
ncbi:MAG: hypothetical protein K9I94_11015 [Bacteroidales bacterium]|nr:hypothetical protein [Bacteroidales bacterium]